MLTISSFLFVFDHISRTKRDIELNLKNFNLVNCEDEKCLLVLCYGIYFSTLFIVLCICPK